MSDHNDPDDRTDGSLSELFDMLSHPLRRRLLMVLVEANPQDEDEFVAEEATVNGDDRETLLVVLHHTHLPKLESAGFIDWDRENEVITRGPRFGEIEPLLELMADHPDELPTDWP